MYKILEAGKLAGNIYQMVVEAPRVAKHCLPGQFVIVKADAVGERIPLTICDYDREAGTITIVFMPIGASTEKFAKLKAGDSFRDFVGPLGCPSELCEEANLEETRKKKILFVAGGVGTAPVYPQMKWLHEHGIDADVKNSLVADGCVIEGTVENCVLFRGVKIEKGAKVKNCILMQDTTVGAKAEMNFVITDKNVTISEYRSLAGTETYPVFVNKGATV